MLIAGSKLILVLKYKDIMIYQDTDTLRYLFNNKEITYNEFLLLKKYAS